MDSHSPIKPRIGFVGMTYWGNGNDKWEKCVKSVGNISLKALYSKAFHLLLK